MLDCYTSPITGQFPDSLLEAAKTARSNAPFGLFTGYYAESQKLTPPGSVNFALGLIDLKLELASNEPANAFHYSLACSLAADINVTVVGVTYEPMASTLQFSVKIIKNYIRQQGRQHSSNNVAKHPITFEAVIHRAQLRASYGQGFQGAGTAPPRMG